MLYRHEYPVCEYDPDREALIRPSDFLQKCLPSRCVITFFRKELEAFVEERGLSVVGHLHSEVVDIPIYADEARSFCITMPFCTSPGAAGTIEELHAMGCERFLICGAAGGLAPGNRTGEIVVPLAAVRDEGASYHYLPPAREVPCHAAAAAALQAGLRQRGIPFAAGKTWTTDAMYRETSALVAHRRAEGCLTVEMEAAGFFAVSAYYGLPLAQLLYVGDDVSGETWDARDWNRQKSVRANLIALLAKLIPTF